MVNNNYKDPNKIVFANWVDKTLDVTLSKRNINNGFKVTWIQPFNPKAMDGRTKPSELYTAEDNIIALNEENAENFDEGLNDNQDWGEHGVVVELINIGIVEEPIIIRSDDDVQGHPPRYYVEELRSPIILGDT